MKESGLDSSVAYSALENLKNSLQLTEEEDRILDVMDVVVGYCRPDERV